MKNVRCSLAASSPAKRILRRSSRIVGKPRRIGYEMRLVCTAHHNIITVTVTYNASKSPLSRRGPNISETWRSYSLTLNAPRYILTLNAELCCAAGLRDPLTSEFYVQAPALFPLRLEHVGQNFTAYSTLDHAYHAAAV